MSSGFDLTGKRAFVTGANTGIGQGIAVLLETYRGGGVVLVLHERSVPLLFEVPAACVHPAARLTRTAPLGSTSCRLQ